MKLGCLLYFLCLGALIGAVTAFMTAPNDDALKVAGLGALAVVLCMVAGRLAYRHEDGLEYEKALARYAAATQAATEPIPEPPIETRFPDTVANLGCLPLILAIALFCAIASLDDEENSRKAAVGSEIAIEVDPDVSSLGGHFVVSSLTASTELNRPHLSLGSRLRLKATVEDKPWGDTIERGRLTWNKVPIGTGLKGIEFDVRTTLPDDTALVGGTCTVRVAGEVKYPHAEYIDSAFVERSKRFEAEREIELIAAEAEESSRMPYLLIGALFLLGFGILVWRGVRREAQIKEAYGPWGPEK